MLRITVHETAGQWRVELAGRLCGPWVAEMENVWRLAKCSDKEIEVDMRDVTGVDGAGRYLLIAMHQAGARLVAKGVEMKALVDDIAAHGRIQRVVPADQRSQVRRKHK
jgi:hypothetical protein